MSRINKSPLPDSKIRLQHSIAYSLVRRGKIFYQKIPVSNDSLVNASIIMVDLWGDVTFWSGLNLLRIAVPSNKDAQKELKARSVFSSADPLIAAIFRRALSCNYLS